MEDYLEEDEIKIEYYDDFETDPLCEKSAKCSIVSSDAVNDILSSSAVQSEKPLISNDVQYDSFDHSSPEITICEPEQEDFEVYMNTEPTNHINWYRAIDETGKFVCRFCDLTYSTVQTIRHHVKTKHPNEANALRNIIKNNKRNPKIKCHICKKRFKAVNNLKEHIKQAHSGNIQRSCQLCFAAFNNDQEITEHLFHKHQKLTNTKIYSCSLCGYQTRKLSHYKQHRNTHLSNKQMKCDSCDYATNYSPNLKIHQRIHSNYKPYLCTFFNCGYRCSAKSALRSHQLKHNPDENMLYCDKCTYKTVYKSSLKKHIESHKRNSLKCV
ncbi:zinc finger protein 708-like isoform X1 [Cydia fagiglandana]|uniref:zinc finger protein 708-like isoform X1 n=1 Tax=Cydia fagiglandana TaxID=1458189 RepID=UPI002FEE531C